MTTNKSDKLTKILITGAGIGICTYLLIKHHKKLSRNFDKLKNTILYDIAKIQRKNFDVHLINSPNECRSIIQQLREHCEVYNVLGFDAEWVTINNERRKVALIQLCSDRGVCALFRICKFNKIPSELREILQDPEIIKVGIACTDDAKKLFEDYAIKVNGAFDLRFLALLANHKAEGLARLSKSVLGIELDKNWRIACSDWEAPSLSDTQIDYAAKDSFVAVEIFKRLYNTARPHMNSPSQISQFCDHYTDISFKNKLAQLNLDPFEESVGDKKILSNSGRKKDFKLMKRSYTKSTNLYDNCFLQAPDGTLLCTCDRRKAEWYISKGLGTQIETDPTFTVRLNFQPAGMPVGEVGEYYQSRKENKCVVCGREDELIRKNVVPHEYRKYFPAIMKDKTSHDILLLCFHCHQISNMSDIKVRKMLETKCDAPIYELPENEDEIRKFRYVQRAAKALLPTSGNKIPDSRRLELQKVVQQAYPDQEVTADFLAELAGKREPIAEHKTCHGELVVDYYKNNEGIIELEKMFRQHFLDAMQPQHMPKLWDVDHSASRLSIRALENRIDPKDLQLAGIDAKTIQNVKSSVMASTSSNNSNSLKVEDECDSVSMLSFYSAAGSNRLNKTDDDKYFSDTTTIASFYETIRSDDSANLSDFQSFENSCNEDSDSDTLSVNSSIHSDTEIEDAAEN